MWDRPLARITGLMAATTVGAGLFALPYVAVKAGWLTGLIYLLLCAKLVQFVHGLYLRTLTAEGGRHRLLGLVTARFGYPGRAAGLIVIIGGLTLTLIAYLILAQSFFGLFSARHALWGTAAFWLFSSLLVIFDLRRLAATEWLGMLAITGIVVGIFTAGLGHNLPEELPLFGWGDLVLPFGPVLFALAGWPAVGVIHDLARKSGLSSREASAAMNRGTALAALVYGLFVFGILATAAEVTPDTITGLTNWAPWAQGALAVLGLFALWTSYVPIGLEIRNSLRDDIGWPEGGSAALVFFLPPFLIWLGLTDFLGVVGLVGGVFLALEYGAILLVAKRSLALTIWEGLWVRFALTLFLLAAVYEIYYFVVK